MINNLSTVETTALETSTPKGKPNKRSCLSIATGHDLTLKILEFASMNYTAEEFKYDLQICATFPNRRGIFVVEITTKMGSTILSRVIQFYEYFEGSGWRFKKQYLDALQ